MTPLRRQYLEIKRRYPGVVVLFRLGDFYETFDDDAALCARELGLTLTSRPLGKSERIPMAGIPHHALAGYLPRLIARGYRVAICDQVGEAAGKRDLVQRQVTRVVTPGTALTDDLLESTAHNFLAAVVVTEDRAGLAHADVSTGVFATAEFPSDALAAELSRIAPTELLLDEGTPEPDGWSGVITRVPPLRDAERRLLDHFRAATLDAFGCAGRPLAVAAAARVLAYLDETQPAAAGQVDGLATYDLAEHMALDPQTRRNLELFEPARSGDRAFSLAATLDRTCTPMGARLLRARLARPLLDRAAIERRLDAVQFLHDDPPLRAELRAALHGGRDLERLLARTAAGQATPRDLAGLRQGLEAAAALRCRLAAVQGPLPALPDCAEAVAQIAAALADDPPAQLSDGGAIRDGYHSELDELRALGRDARLMLAEIERRERDRTGIRSLRVTYNRVFGYAIEVSNANLHLVPEEYQRRQTLAGGERFITPELKEYESRALGAQERAAALEAALFRDLCAAIAGHGPRIRALATALAEIDLAASHAETAALHDYCRPAFTDSAVLTIEAGRHPVVERALPPGTFVANDAHLDDDARILILTGPNMAGKSTYLRQVALLVLMAQTGSFVPAAAMRLGIVDRIFTRVGAQDDLAAGASTFMVEMVETAHILHHATPRSLIVLDEVGRGTSTFDGLAIARAIVEYLHNRAAVAAKTLFATHYHELTALARTLPHVHTAGVAVVEQDGEVVFLRRIVPGGANRSFGIHVAQLAGMPRPVVQRATELLAELEEEATARRARGSGRRARAEGVQISLFAAPSPLTDELAALDLDGLSPLDALTKLYELRDRARALTAAPAAPAFG